MAFKFNERVRVTKQSTEYDVKYRDDEDKDVTIDVIKTYSNIDEPIRKTFVGDE